MKRLLLTACFITLLPLAASAADNRACCRPEPNWYVGLSGMAVFLKDTDISHPGFTTAGGVDGQTYDIGYGLAGAVGYRIFSNIRMEFELAFRSNDVDTDPGADFVGGPAGTHEQKSIAVMLNTYYDYHNRTRFTPYAGAGIGKAYVKNPRFYTTGGGDTGTLKGWTIAYQFMGGINYELDSIPAELNLGYRYFTGQDLEKALPPASGNVSVPNDSHNVELGGKMFF